MYIYIEIYSNFASRKKRKTILKQSKVEQKETKIVKTTKNRIAYGTFFNPHRHLRIRSYLQL